MTIIQQVMAKFGPEDWEQFEVLKYCDRNGHYAWHVPNNTYTQNRFAKIKNKLLGVKKGVSDLFIIVRQQLIVIEMKSLDGHPTKEQREFIERMMRCNIPATVAKGADEAISFIKVFEDGTMPSYQPLSSPRPQETIINPPSFDDLPF